MRVTPPRSSAITAGPRPPPPRAPRTPRPPAPPRPSAPPPPPAGRVGPVLGDERGEEAVESRQPLPLLRARDRLQAAGVHQAEAAHLPLDHGDAGARHARVDAEHPHTTPPYPTDSSTSSG